MSFAQPTTKADISEIKNTFASIFSRNTDQQDQKSSQSPPNQQIASNSTNNNNNPSRPVFRGQRRFNSNGERKVLLPVNQNNNNNPSQPTIRPVISRDDRLKRKRKFNVFQTDSSQLASLLDSADTIRLHNRTLCYVRKESFPFGVYNDNNTAQSSSTSNINNNNPNVVNNTFVNSFGNTNDFGGFNGSNQFASCNSSFNTNNNNNNNNLNRNTVAMGQNPDDQKMDGNNAFSMMMKASKKSNDDDTMMRDMNGGINEWVTVFASYDEACNDNHWKLSNKCGKIEEYQIKTSDHIYILNLDSIKDNDINIDINYHINNIKQFLLSNGYSGYLYNNEYKLYNPHEYWRLVDDNKLKKMSQCLISDMFRKRQLYSNNNNNINQPNQQNQFQFGNNNNYTNNNNINDNINNNNNGFSNTFSGVSGNNGTNWFGNGFNSGFGSNSFGNNNKSDNHGQK